MFDLVIHFIHLLVCVVFNLQHSPDQQVLGAPPDTTWAKMLNAAQRRDYAELKTLHLQPPPLNLT